ncbi:hypothetical protein H1C71_026909 [Ictidomys tridecemlineatus]|nr:hypothetical protein H1C71_026909 [Ictidomys tridecemlineatus]
MQPSGSPPENLTTATTSPKPPLVLCPPPPESAGLITRPASGDALCSSGMAHPQGSTGLVFWSVSSLGFFPSRSARLYYPGLLVLPGRCPRSALPQTSTEPMLSFPSGLCSEAFL